MPYPLFIGDTDGSGLKRVCSIIILMEESELSPSPLGSQTTSYFHATEYVCDTLTMLVSLAFSSWLDRPGGLRYTQSTDEEWHGHSKVLCQDHVAGLTSDPVPFPRFHRCPGSDWGDHLPPGRMALSGPPEMTGTQASVYRLHSKLRFTAWVYREDKKKREAWYKTLLVHSGLSFSAPTGKPA